MPNSNYLAGRRFEYETIKSLTEDGYKCIRASGSHGPFDVVAWKPRCTLFIQCKVVSKITDAERLARQWLTNPPEPPGTVSFSQQLRVKIKGKEVRTTTV